MIKYLYYELDHVDNISDFSLCHLYANQHVTFAAELGG